VQWVAENIVWIAATVVLCFVLSVAASMWLERFNDRKAREWGAARGIWSRADMVLPPPVRGVIAPEQPAIAPQVVNFNFYGVDATRASAVIHQALAGTAGDTIAEKN
jgi:peptidoglycan/LPS O-acetylase OafA/YrhL